MATVASAEPTARPADRATPVAKAVGLRLTSADAFRGFVMLLMMAEVLNIGRVARAFPDSPTWQFLKFHTSHVEWVGCSLHDMIQPSFSFLVGVAVPFSIAARLGRGQSRRRLFAHALWRAVALTFIGIFLRSVGKSLTLWEFTDTLCQIGLGYPFLFLLGFCSQRIRWAAVAVLLGGYWLAFALYPASGPDFASHWAKNANAASAFDLWFLNLFPRTSAFTGSSGGYATLSFIPTLATMTLGLIAGDFLRGDQSTGRKVLGLVVAGAAGLAAGLALDWAGVCPVVKRIWTPAWVLYSGGWCALLLAGFYAIIDAAGLKRWSLVLVVIGMNSIAMYCIDHLTRDFLSGTLTTHFGRDAFKFAALGDAYEPLLRGAAILGIWWLIAVWMYRRKVFLRV